MRAHLVLPALALGNVYDLFMPHYLSGCRDGCAEWSSVAGAASLFLDGKVPAEAEAVCAMPGGSAGPHTGKGAPELDAIKFMNQSYAGPWCFCQDGTQKYCTPPSRVVEQLNLQLAASDVVVASFVTYDDGSEKPASGMLGAHIDSMTAVHGVSHKYSPPHRRYVMHYVPFRGLRPGQTYHYKVRSGGSGWTDVYSFRMPAAGVTRIATFGDMGHSRYNNMANLKADCEAGTIDAIVMMGDHAYDLGMTEDRRGDAYMNAFQPVLQSCPWLPMIGNHEANDGDNKAHFDQITDGLVVGRSALLQHLSLGMFHGAASHGSSPSNTPRYLSVDIGLLHVTVIDREWGTDEMWDWFKADLEAANANREAVPWIMVTSHYPMYNTNVAAHLDASAAAFFSERAEYLETSERFQSCVANGEPEDCETLGHWQLKGTNAIEAILLNYSVDIYNSGHVHRYQSTWPMKNGEVCSKSYDNPICPIYIVEGNGGRPGCDGNCTLEGCERAKNWCRVTGSECGSYGRIIIKDAETLTYEHVRNVDGVVSDSFTLEHAKHGPFKPTQVLV